ncbi:MAG: nitrilase family protein [Bacteroidetes bacterium]|nr:nitrilase family protein [Bacteroidota bacterium]
MQDLRVTLIQSNIFWEEPQKNLEHFGYLINRIPDPTDLILLPEVFNTGFSMNPDLCSEDIHGISMQFLRRMAGEKDAAIMATLMISEESNYYNRLVCMHPDGHFETYNKRHLFRLSEEFQILTRGNSHRVFNVNGWKILPLICYDLRFPVWSKNICTDGVYGYDLLVNLANWPASRSQIWKTLLMARAIENQACVVGVNRIGKDGQDIWHSGDSMAINAEGNVLFIAGESQEVRTISFSSQELELFRESFTIGLDWDHFSINLKK